MGFRFGSMSNLLRTKRKILCPLQITANLHNIKKKCFRLAYRFGINLRSIPVDIHIESRQLDRYRFRRVHMVPQSIRRCLFVIRKRRMKNEKKEGNYIRNHLRKISMALENNSILIPTLLHNRNED